ncbi:MAG: restriction endonuclease subunit S [Stenotrophomonas sp.]|uniref:restriction endonuclease subunit S n=1 Tax=Stenotrophomonas sp. TaxID=69392 RepID=UPI003D6DA6B0
MSDLPSQWHATKLGNLVTVIRGVTFPASAKSYELNDSHIPCLRTSHIQRELRWDDVYLIPASYVKRDEQLLRRGDILMSMANSANLVGKTCINDTDNVACFGAFLAAIRCSHVEHKYVYYFLRSAFAQSYLKNSASQTVNIANISVSELEKLTIPLPPLSEQARIVKALDGFLAQVDTLKARLDALPTLIDRFRQSVLSTAISGKLTSSTKSDWRSMKAAEACAKVQSGGTPKVGFFDSGVPFLKVYNIVKNKIDFDYKPQFVNEESHSHSLLKSKTVPGDVLMNIVGPPLGKIATVPSTHLEWNINQAIALFRPSDKITSEWLSISLHGGEALKKVILETRGIAGQVNISLSQCRDFVFEVPPVVEQVTIGNKTSQLFAFADQLEARITDARQRVDALTQSILAKAFRGELVPQDPNDEPASVLLERIAAQRAADPKPKRGRKAAAH